MSKRTADYQLTSENYDKLELCVEEPGNGESLLGGKTCVNDDGNEDSVVTSKEEIASRKMVRIRKKYSLDDNAHQGTFSEKVPSESEGKAKEKSEGKRDERESSGDGAADNKENDSSDEKLKTIGKDDVNQGEDCRHSERGMNNADCKKDIDEKEKKDGKSTFKDEGDREKERQTNDSLPFGNTGLSSSFKNPFVLLATNNEGNFLFSSSGNSNNSDNVFGRKSNLGDLNGVGFGEDGNLENEDERDEDDQDSNDEEPIKKVFTGEENEETVYQCKNVDLFVLKELEDGQKSFKKVGSGIVHLNIPKDNLEACCGEDNTGSGNSEEDSSSVSQIKRPRIIFRQSGIYKLLLNTPLNKEISKTFKKNTNIRKGYAVNFVGFNEESEAIQCMIRFQNIVDLDEFIDKVNEKIND